MTLSMQELREEFRTVESIFRPFKNGEPEAYLEVFNKVFVLNRHDIRRSLLRGVARWKYFPKPSEVICEFERTLEKPAESKCNKDPLLLWEEIRTAARRAMLDVEFREPETIHESELFDRTKPLFLESFQEKSIPLSAYMGCFDRVPMERRREFLEMAGKFGTQR